MPARTSFAEQNVSKGIFLAAYHHVTLTALHHNMHHIQIRGAAECAKHPESATGPQGPMGVLSSGWNPLQGTNLTCNLVHVI